MRAIGFLILLVASTCVLATTTYNCSFGSFSDNKGNHADKLELAFLIDDESEKAYIIGNNGSSEVAHIYRGDGRSFVEITGTGNVMVTTIAPNLKAVHSRNSVMLGQIIPSQYYGECVVR